MVKYELSFGEALAALQAGMRVTLFGWEDRWVVLMPSLDLPPFSSQTPGAKVNDRTAKHIGRDTPLRSQPYFAQWDRGLWRPGWLPSAAELLSPHWAIMEQE
jgi:hypothetical protein